MVPTAWLLVAFLAGTGTGALIVSIHRIATLSRIREEFKAELDALTEQKAGPAADKSQAGAPHRAA